MISTLPTLADLALELSALGAAPAHSRRVLRQWAAARSLDAGRPKAEHYLPATLREALPGLSERWGQLARLASRHPATDGSERFLVTLSDGQTVESVLLLREGLCVSTQVGCAVGCVFCMTGRSGLIRQLTSAEIVAQVVLARQHRTVRKVVFMGMGEPSHNLEQVLEAIAFLGNEGGIAHKNLVFSTVGDTRAFERLEQSKVKPALALSLHSTQADLRARLLPRAPRLTPQELVERGDAYARQSGYPMQVQWTLLDGVNDTDEELDALATLLAGRYAMLNLIPFNPVEGETWKRPPVDRILAMTRALNSRGILTRIRQSAGQDVEGGCGQLRARSEASAVTFTRRRPPPSLPLSS